MNVSVAGKQSTRGESVNKSESYLDKVRSGVEAAHVAHLLVALRAAVVVGRLCGAAHVEEGLAERTTRFGFRVWRRLFLLLLLLWTRASRPLLGRLRTKGLGWSGS